MLTNIVGVTSLLTVTLPPIIETLEQINTIQLALSEVTNLINEIDSITLLMLTQTSLVEQILTQILPPVTITNIVGEIDIVTPLPLVVMQSVAVVVTELLTALVPVLSLTSTLPLSFATVLGGLKNRDETPGNASAPLSIATTVIPSSILSYASACPNMDSYINACLCLDARLSTTTVSASTVTSTSTVSASTLTIPLTLTTTGGLTVAAPIVTELLTLTML